MERNNSDNIKNMTETQTTRTKQQQQKDQRNTDVYCGWVEKSTYIDNGFKSGPGSLVVCVVPSPHSVRLNVLLQACGCVHLWTESETLSVEHLLYSACPEERLVYGCVHLWTGTLYRVPRGVIGQWVCTPVDRNIPLCRVPRGAIDLWVCTPVDRNIILRA